MLSATFPVICFLSFLCISCLFDRENASIKLEDEVYSSLESLSYPIYFDSSLVHKLTAEHEVGPLDVSECIYILQRKGRIQKTYLDGKRSLLVKEFTDPPRDHEMLTFVLVGNSLYVRGDDLHSWAKHDDWIIRLGK
jgi:hypothetical protein